MGGSIPMGALMRLSGAHVVRGGSRSLRRVSPLVGVLNPFVVDLPAPVNLNV